MILQLETGLDNLVGLINQNCPLDIRPAYHGQDERKAIWIVGNYKIVAQAVDIRLTELETTNFRRVPDKLAENKTKTLIQWLEGKLNRIPIDSKKMDNARMAEKTMAKMPPSQSAHDNDESYQVAVQAFKAERERLKNLTDEQAVDEEFQGKEMYSTIGVNAKTYKLSRPIDKGNVMDFYGRFADYAEDNKKKPLYHFATTQELLNFGRAHITFGINGDKGDIAVSTDNGYLHLKAFVHDDLIPLLENEWASLYTWLIQNGWLLERENNPTFDDQIEQRERREKFDCPQEELLDILIDLALQNQWPQGYSLNAEPERPTPGYIQLLIDKHRILNPQGRNDYEYIGRITIGKIGNQVSTLAIRSHNPDLLQCFDELTKIVSKYVHMRLEPTTEADLTAKPEKLQKKNGRKRLCEADPNEFIYRIAKAQEGTELYNTQRNSNFTWSNVCKQINWKHGFDKSGTKLFYFARLDYEQLKKSDPDNWMRKVRDFREKEKKKSE